jgi:hypothetical protein
MRRIVTQALSESFSNPTSQMINPLGAVRGLAYAALPSAIFWAMLLFWVSRR